jgi:hypothetical protein
VPSANLEGNVSTETGRKGELKKMGEEFIGSIAEI